MTLTLFALIFGTKFGSILYFRCNRLFGSLGLVQFSTTNHGSCAQRWPTYHPPDEAILSALLCLGRGVIRPGLGMTAPSSSSPPVHSAGSPLTLFVACLILLGCCSVCVVAQLRAYQRRRLRGEENEPLLDPAYDPYGTPANGVRGRGADMAAIGTPARDFVRLSSLPSSALRVDEHGRRCMACSAENGCVALRPCGHVVLCRACSDFVYTCPHCGQYISGIVFKPKTEDHGSSDKRALRR